MEVVRALLEREDVNLDWADKSGITPLIWAVETGHEEVVQILSKREDPKSCRADTDYTQTLLSKAAEQRNDRAANMLLQPTNILPATPDNVNQIPPSLLPPQEHN